MLYSIAVRRPHRLASGAVEVSTDHRNQNHASSACDGRRHRLRRALTSSGWSKLTVSCRGALLSACAVSPVSTASRPLRFDRLPRRPAPSPASASTRSGPVGRQGVRLPVIPRQRHSMPRERRQRRFGRAPVVFVHTSRQYPFYVFLVLRPLVTMGNRKQKDQKECRYRNERSSQRLQDLQGRDVHPHRYYCGVGNGYRLEFAVLLGARESILQPPVIFDGEKKAHDECRRRKERSQAPGGLQGSLWNSEIRPCSHDGGIDNGRREWLIDQARTRQRVAC